MPIDPRVRIQRHDAMPAMCHHEGTMERVFGSLQLWMDDAVNAPKRRTRSANGNQLPCHGLIAVLFRFADISADDALELFLRELRGRPVADHLFRSEGVSLWILHRPVLAHVNPPVQLTTQVRSGF
jgi:hypothetical protein